MSFNQQQESIKRLNNPLIEVIQEITQAESEERERLKLEYQKQREEKQRQEAAKPTRQDLLQSQFNAITFEDI